MASSKPGSKVRLLIGIVLLGIATISATMVWSGVTELRRVAQETVANVAKKKTHIDLAVLGTTMAHLKPQVYSIWLQGDDLDALGGADLDASDLPAVQWDIWGPEAVVVSHNMQVRVDDYRLAGTFSIQQEGEYQFVARFPEGVENDYRYNIGDDPTAVFGETLSGLAESAASFFKILIGAGVGSISALTGTIILIIHFVRSPSAEKKGPPMLLE